MKALCKERSTKNTKTNGFQQKKKEEKKKVCPHMPFFDISTRTASNQVI